MPEPGWAEPQNHCLGPLEPGEYTTTVFEPTLTYSVPAGWANMEDLPGNFLLVPPGGDLAGVNPMTSDFIGVYSSVAAPSICDEGVDGNVERSAAAMVEWMQQQPALVVSEPLPVTVGGLDGLQIDVALSESEACSDPAIADSYALVIIGVGPSHLTHGVVPDYRLRLMLLDSGNGVLAVELADAPAGGSDFDDWWTAAADITDTFDFTTSVDPSDSETEVASGTVPTDSATSSLAVTSVPSSIDNALDATAPANTTPTGTEMVIEATAPYPSWDEFDGGEGDFPTLYHRVHGFEVNGTPWVLLDEATGWAGGVFQSTWLMIPTAGAFASPQPECCMDIDGVSWEAYHDLPASVAYATFTFDGTPGWERPNNGVVIVPSADVVLVDSAGEVTTPDLTPLRRHIPVDTPAPPDPINQPEVGSLAEVFQSATAACLSDANFDMYATDAASDATWAHCVDVGVAEWNNAIANTTPSSTSP